MGDKAFITVKGETDAAGKRSEFEYEIPIADAKEMMGLCAPYLIEKTRYTVNDAGNSWEIDEFHGHNQGLVIAEIEETDDGIAPRHRGAPGLVGGGRHDLVRIRQRPPLPAPVHKNGDAVFGCALVSAVVAWGVRRPFGRRPGHRTWCRSRFEGRGCPPEEGGIVPRNDPAPLDEVKSCYDQELSRQPTLAGRIDVQFTIAPSGTNQRGQRTEIDARKRIRRELHRRGAPSLGVPEAARPPPREHQLPLHLVTAGSEVADAGAGCPDDARVGSELKTQNPAGVRLPPECPSVSGNATAERSLERVGRIIQELRPQRVTIQFETDGAGGGRGVAGA